MDNKNFSGLIFANCYWLAKNAKINSSWKLPTIWNQYRSSMVAKGVHVLGNVLFCRLTLENDTPGIAYLWQGWLWSLSLLIFIHDCLVQEALWGQHSLLVAFSFPVEFSLGGGVYLFYLGLLGHRNSSGRSGGHWTNIQPTNPCINAVWAWPPCSAWVGGRVLPSVAMTTVLQSGHFR